MSDYAVQSHHLEFHYIPAHPTSLTLTAKKILPTAISWVASAADSFPFRAIFINGFTYALFYLLWA